MIPRYKHDCDSCIFLGRFTRSLTSPNDQPVEHDLYYCPKTEFSGSVIARYGSEGSEYQSTAIELLAGIDCGPELAEGMRRAIRFMAAKLEIYEKAVESLETIIGTISKDL